MTSNDKADDEEAEMDSGGLGLLRGFSSGLCAGRGMSTCALCLFVSVCVKGIKKTQQNSVTCP